MAYHLLLRVNNEIKYDEASRFHEDQYFLIAYDFFKKRRKIINEKDSLKKDITKFIIICLLGFSSIIILAGISSVFLYSAVVICLFYILLLVTRFAKVLTSLQNSVYRANRKNVTTKY